MRRLVLAAVALLLVAPHALASPRFDFRVLSVERAGPSVEVVTPGARFSFRPEGIEAHQRIGRDRQVAAVTIAGLRAARWRIARRSTEECLLAEASTGLRAEVSGDSVLRLRGAQATSVTGPADFDPEYRYQEAASVVLLDDVGGVCLCGPTGGYARVTGLYGGAWRVEHPDLDGRALLLGVCPPRPFDWQQAHDDIIVHFFPRFESDYHSDRPLPTDEELAEWRKVGNVLVLHLEMWDGFGVRRIQPRDPARFAQVIERAHELDWRVLLYTSPYYYGASNRVEDFEAEMRHLLAYGPDGLYWDGTYLDVEKAWDIARRARKLLGERPLYVHCTSTPPTHPRMVVPFVDTYADYILRGEGFGRDFMDPLYLRYVVSGYNVSNAVGTLCYETCRLNDDTVASMLGVNARLPYWPGGQSFGSGRDYFLHDDERALYLQRYLPAAKQIVDEQTWSEWRRPETARRRAYVKTYRRTQQQNLAALRQYLRARRIELADQCRGNLAAFKPIRASDMSCTERGLHGLADRVEYANDANDETYWAADFAPDWIEVDLTQRALIGRVVVRNYFKDDRFYHYRVEASTDRRTWSLLAEKLDDARATPAGDTHTFPPRPARFIRLTMLHNSANVGLHVTELEVYPARNSGTVSPFPERPSTGNTSRGNG